ncbi:LysR family transcriptional regulator [Lentilactobacillus sp. Marseille-Q4993]|uniref:LysR family transcriptional regulator n=1 Tax=Lentilactobacillus sp. Marseille-Q4993 TaxID=3039492 RepID=UPI0024BCADC1|nr:LysR family transcriptional regulator [Lentilactobacillus sp. Marseille-Q4993]
MFKFLETFVVVYETRSFSLAAQQLFITQPTVSNQINQLERQFQIVLFERENKRLVVPTKAADILYKRANKMLSEWRDISEVVQQANEEKHHLNFGVSQTIAEIFFAKIGQKFIESMPEVEFNVAVSNSETVMRQLQTRKIDVGLIEKPIVFENIERISVASDQLDLVGQETGIWITREAGSGIEYYTNEYWRQEGITPKKTIRVSSIGLIKQMVAAGMGQAILSEKSIDESIKHKRLDNRFIRDFYLVVQKSDISSKLYKEVIELIKEVMGG